METERSGICWTWMGRRGGWRSFPAHHLSLFFFFLLGEPQRTVSSEEEGPPPTKTKAKQKAAVGLRGVGVVN